MFLVEDPEMRAALAEQVYPVLEGEGLLLQPQLT